MPDPRAKVEHTPIVLVMNQDQFKGKWKQFKGNCEACGMRRARLGSPFIVKIRRLGPSLIRDGNQRFLSYTLE